jgi:hypothetical protein
MVYFSLTSFNPTNNGTAASDLLAMDGDDGAAYARMR